MLLAALLIAVAALVLATVSLTIQVTLLLTVRKSLPQEAIMAELPPEAQAFISGPTSQELTAPKVPEHKILQEQQLMEDAFENPDEPFTGIDERFGL